MHAIDKAKPESDADHFETAGAARHPGSSRGVNVCDSRTRHAFHLLFKRGGIKDIRVDTDLGEAARRFSWTSEYPGALR